MQNLEIIIYLKTEMIPGPYPINLDSLLYWSALQGCRDNQKEAFGILNKALASKDGIYKSSDICYLYTKSKPITFGTKSFPTCLSWEEFSYDIGKTHIMELGGPYRSRLTKYQTIKPVAVSFYAVGDMTIIDFLLQSIGGIGKSNNQGFGEIDSICIKEVDEDFSWVRKTKNGMSLARSLPEITVLKEPLLKEAILNMELQSVRVTPPYTTSKDILGYGPPLSSKLVDVV